MHIQPYFKKSDSDISGMSQQMPIDITSPTTPSEHESSVSCQQSQPAHSGKLKLCNHHIHHTPSPASTIFFLNIHFDSYVRSILFSLYWLNNANINCNCIARQAKAQFNAICIFEMKLQIEYLNKNIT